MSKQRLGDADIEPKYARKMEILAETLDKFLNKELKGDQREVGFVLLLFEYGEHEGRCNFISNGADRKDVIALFKEMIARFEGQPEMKGHA